ncbi:MAG: DUF3179 domain-containing protein [Alphaproteobacteria bacterium]|nr:DUF3179 domain-containing protein [Alphaproteobacteria bacterium]
MAGARRIAHTLLAAAAIFAAVVGGRAEGAEIEAATLGRMVRDALYDGDLARRKAVAAALAERANLDVVPAFVEGLRYFQDHDRVFVGLLQRLTGAAIENDWYAWMEWLESRPDIVAFPGYDAFKGDFMALIDDEFRSFFYAGVKRAIRLEEINWAGFNKDRIPALVDPEYDLADAAYYLNPGDIVFGIEIDGDARAYPKRIMDWHEIVNDTVGGVPVTLAYCALSNAALLYDAVPPGRRQRLTFGNSGFAHHSNKLMFDAETDTLWHQATGRPVVGELTGSAPLAMRPLTVTTWRAWRSLHPDSKVLTLYTGYDRDYRPNAAYVVYATEANPMFPAFLADRRLAPKDVVYVLDEAGAEKAWPIAAFAGAGIVHDRVGERAVVVIGETASATVRAYASGGRRFAPGNGTSLTSEGQVWRLTETALVGPDGARLPRLNGHITYWFAWAAFKPNRPLYRG